MRVVRHSVRQGYDNLPVDQILAQLLPAGVEVPSGCVCVRALQQLASGTAQLTAGAAAVVRTKQKIQTVLKEI